MNLQTSNEVALALEIQSLRDEITSLQSTIDQLRAENRKLEKALSLSRQHKEEGEVIGQCNCSWHKRLRMHGS